MKDIPQDPCLVPKRRKGKKLRERVLSETTFIPWIINTFENETTLQILDQSFQKRSVRKVKQGDWNFCKPVIILETHLASLGHQNNTAFVII